MDVDPENGVSDRTKYLAAFDLLSDPVILWDAEQARVIFRNASAAILTTKLRTASLDPDAPDTWVGQLAQADLSNPNCERIPLLDRVFDVCQQPGPARTEVIAVLRDVTAQIEEERTRRELSSTVSHELRSPLTAIKGATGLVLSGAAGALSEKSRELIGMAHRNADRLILIVNDILDLDKIADGAMVFDNVDADLADIAQDAIEAIAGYQSRFDVAVDLEIEGEGLRSHVDPNRMVQVLVNLLSNAIKFSPVGSRVQLRLSRRGITNRISVVDQGEGIPEDAQATLFERFVQVGARHRAAKGGTGLGLSIVKAIVDHQGGTVSFKSIEGEGTTFHVDLPAVVDERPAKTEEVKRVS